MQDYSGNQQSPSLIPTDLVLVGLLGVFTIAVGADLFESLPGRSLLGLLAVLFAPGYATVSALFPKKNSDSALFEDIQAVVTTAEGGVTAIERLLLAVGLSVCLVPLLGVGLNFTPQGIDSATLLGVIGALTIVLTVIAAVRRRQVLPRERFDPTLTGFAGNTIRQFNTARRRSPITILLVLGLVVAAGGIGVAVLDADRGERFTEFYLLSEDPETGASVAESYPDEISIGDSESITVGITNNEGQTIEYSVVVQLQSIGPEGAIQEVQTLDRFDPVVGPNETWEQRHQISPELTGEDLRVTYLLFTDEELENTLYRPDDAYRSVHFWIDVPGTQSGIEGQDGDQIINQTETGNESGAQPGTDTGSDDSSEIDTGSDEIDDQSGNESDAGNQSELETDERSVATNQSETTNRTETTDQSDDP